MVSPRIRRLCRNSNFRNGINLQPWSYQYRYPGWSGSCSPCQG
jgi:hypothetical protein